MIALARDACKNDPAIVFPRRAVTRPASPFEDNVRLSEEEFVHAKGAGGFALCWQAHGHRYGIPVTIEDDLRAGRTVVCNVSRTIVGEAARRWPVTVVWVTAPPEVLAARIARRGRESDGRPSERLSRKLAFDADIIPDVTIQNVGAPEQGAQELLLALRSRTMNAVTAAR